MEHRSGQNHHNAPLWWSAGLAGRDQVHHGHHPPHKSAAHFGKAEPMPRSDQDRVTFTSSRLPNEVGERGRPAVLAFYISN
jgi:hypothetical protein